MQGIFQIIRASEERKIWAEVNQIYFQIILMKQQLHEGVINRSSEALINKSGAKQQMLLPPPCSVVVG